MLYSRFLWHIVLPVGDFLFKSKYRKYLLEVNKTLHQDRQRINDIQQDSLKSMLDYTVNSSSYYKNLNIVREEDSIQWLKKFPILTKDIIRQQGIRILTQKNGLIKNSTSGSTGIQTEIFINKNEQSLIRAIQTTWWRWAGYEVGNPMLQTGLSTKRTIEKRLKDIFFKVYYLFAFGLTKENTEQGLKWARRKKPFLGGYASSLYVLANIAESESIQMKSAISWGDKLFDHYKDKIKEVFNCEIFETYGTGEGLMLGAQKDLNYLYVMDPYFIVEILDAEGNEVSDGEIGHVVVTSLIHRVMPLIRYRVGDLAIKLPKNEYPSNPQLSLSLFKKIIGK